MSVDNILKQLAKQYVKLPTQPKPEDTSAYDDVPDDAFARPYEERRSTVVRSGDLPPPLKIMPSERIILGAVRGKPAPQRAPVLLSDFPPDELDWLLDTPVRRDMDFQHWLAVCGLPMDLHETHDEIYTLCATTFLARKRESHRR